MTLEVRIYKNATGLANGAFARPFAYSGISAYESTDPDRPPGRINTMDWSACHRQKFSQILLARQRLTHPWLNSTEVFFTSPT